ncbi:peptidase inhibitor family I36 protein [Streptomyces nitrosporeus]|uniref:peptidase inhibitor family I36 protein n=1 Tax=Streptomyces nitrosporeus TaxID=28894 RepID=UPI003333B3B3
MRTTVLAAVLAATAILPATALAPAHDASAGTTSAVREPAHPGAHRAGPVRPGGSAGLPGPAGQARPGQPAAPRGLAPCGAGQLCLWPKPDFAGAVQTHELSAVDIESCVPLASGSAAQALVNRTGRPVTTYQSAECGETGEFETYPGGGTWVPRSPYTVRAFKIWEN